MKNINVILVAIIAFFAISCDDYLDIKPKGELIPETAEDYEKMLNYAQLLKASEYYPIYLTDDVFIPATVAEGGGILGLDQMESYFKNLYTFQSEVFAEGKDDGFWKEAYNRIYYYNVVIEEALGAKEATEKEKHSLRAEALLGRAFEYLTLVNGYAKHYDAATASQDAGVPLILDTDINRTDITRATVQEVYNQIEKDLKEAIEDLPTKPKLNAFRASMPAGLGMLARMYLYMGDYQKALEYANKSLAQNSFLQDMKTNSLSATSKWIGRTDVPDGENNGENIYIRFAPWIFAPSVRTFVSESLLNLYDKEKDQRFLLFATNAIPPYFDFGDNYLWMPYLRTNMAMSTPEMYLIAAECEARVGSKEKAMELINTLRDNRIMDNTPLTATSQDDALVKVLEERRREIPFNGCTRLIDLKRLNKDSRFAKTIVHKVGNVEYKLEPGDAKYILPIPSKVLEKNPNMKPNNR